MPIMDESDVSLPKATLSKMIKELVPGDLRVRQDSLDMLIDCCTEFVSLLSSESNDVSNQERKNTIHAEHVLRALEELGFGEFIPEVKETWDSWKQESKQKTMNLRPRGHKTAAEAAGFTEEEQIALQQRLFADARARSHSLHDNPPAAFLPDHPPRDLTVPIDLSASPSGSTISMTSQSAAYYSDLSARSDVLPIQPLPVPPLNSQFRPNVFSCGVDLTSAPLSAETGSQLETTQQQQLLDISHISMSQPVILLHNGVQHAVSLQKLLPQVAALPQFSNLQQQMLQNAEQSLPMDFSLQMPVGSQIPALQQPSFPESIHASGPHDQEMVQEPECKEKIDTAGEVMNPAKTSPNQSV